MPSAGRVPASIRAALLGVLLAVPITAWAAPSPAEATAALQRRDWSGAVRLAGNLIAADAGAADGYRIRGLAETKLGRYPEALADFRAALDRSPRDVESVLGRGRCHRLMRQYDAAVTDFTLAHTLAPAAARPLCERGAILILQGKYDASLADYEAAKKLDPRYPGLYSYFAEIYLYMRRPADALAAAQTGLQREPQAVINRINLAHSLLFLGRDQEAETVYLQIQNVMDEGKQIPGRAVVANDFRQMREAGISIPEMAKVEAELGIR